MHLAWLESVSQTMQMEAQFFQAMVENGEKLNQCFSKNAVLPSGTDINQCYREMLQALADAHHQRLENVAQLSHAFRRCLWVEI